MTWTKIGYEELPKIDYGANIDVPPYHFFEPQGFKKVNLGKSIFGFVMPINPVLARKRYETLVEKLEKNFKIISEEVVFGGQIILEETYLLSWDARTEAVLCPDANEGRDKQGIYFESKNGLVRIYKNEEGLTKEIIIDKKARFTDFLKEGFLIGPHFIWSGGEYSTLSRKEVLAEWTCRRGILGTKLSLEENSSPIFLYVEGDGDRFYKENTPSIRYLPPPKNFDLYCSCSYNPKDDSNKLLEKIIKETLKIK